MSHISPVVWQVLVKWLMNANPVSAGSVENRAWGWTRCTCFVVLVGLVGLRRSSILLVTSVYNSVQPRSVIRWRLPNRRPRTLLEATWTIIPLGLFLIMFVWGALLYFRIYTPPANAMNIYVVGKQWMWKVEHPGGQHEINSLHVPVGRAVQLTLISRGRVSTSFRFAFRVKARGDAQALYGRYGFEDHDAGCLSAYSARSIAALTTRT